MGFWNQPKKTLLRRALFQIHLWTGVAVGVYMVFISITGSAVVFRRDLNTSLLGNIPGVAQHTEKVIIAVVFLSILPGIVEYLRNRRKPAAAVTPTPPAA